MPSLAGFLSRWVTPALGESGFQRDGRGYRLMARGGLAIVDVRRWPLHPDFVTFWVDVEVSPAPLVEWALAQLSPGERRIENVHWGNGRMRLHPGRHTLEEASALMPGHQRQWLNHDPPWIFAKAGEATACGQDLQGKLSRVVPDLLALLDAETFLTRLRADRAAMPLHMDGDWTEAVLLSERGDSPELVLLLRQIDDRWPDQALTSWVRERVAHRAGADRGGIG